LADAGSEQFFAKAQQPAKLYPKSKKQIKLQTKNKKIR